MEDRPVVVLWKRAWLPGTETFIRNQQDAYRGYQAQAVGMLRQDSPLARETDLLVLEGAALRRLRAKVLSALGISPLLLRRLRQLRPALIHAHFGPEGMAISRTARRLGVPLVVTFHGHDISRAPEVPGWRGRRYRRRLRVLFREADAFIAVSEAIRQRAVDLGCPPEKLHVRYTGTPLTDDEPEEPTGGRRWDVAFVGRLLPKKGPHHLLSAVAAAQERLGRSVRTVVAGDGPLRAELEDQARRLGLDVDFLGHQDQQGVREVLDSSRIFCAPSRRENAGEMEGFGMVFVEAADRGLPVVAYDFTGVREAVLEGTTALLAPEDDVQALSENLVRLLEDPALARRMGRAGRERVRREFELGRCVERIEQLYDEVRGARLSG